MEIPLFILAVLVVHGFLALFILLFHLTWGALDELEESGKCGCCECAERRRRNGESR